MDSVDKKWYASYDYSYNGIRCIKKQEPVLKPSTNRGKRFNTEQDATDYYRSRVKSHADYLLSKIRAITNGAINKSLRKYKLDREASILDDINRLVQEYYGVDI